MAKYKNIEVLEILNQLRDAKYLYKICLPNSLIRDFDSIDDECIEI